jgi:hypothetical protein
MWIMLSDAFVSIVQKDCERDELMVRARRPGDLEKLFPELVGKVQEFTSSDYHYRAAVKRERVESIIAAEVRRVVYPNFKDSVRDDDLHHAYMDVWTAMAKVQPKRPYAGRKPSTFFSDIDFETAKQPAKAPAKRKSKNGK